MPFTKTVLQVIPELESGGAERTTVEIARAIVAEGGRAIVATHGGRLAREIEALGGTVFHMPAHSKNPLVILANRGRLIRLIRDHAVDIVHVRSRAPAWSALWAARAAGAPLVATYHGAYAAKGPIKRFYNSAMVRADLVIANSNFTAAAICAAYDIDAGRLAIIPRGADLARFDPEAVDAARIGAVEKTWSVNHNSSGFRLLLPARLTAWKGQMDAIAAVARLAEPRAPGSARTGHAPGLQLILAGDAQGREHYVKALRREIETRGVREMVHLVGHCADMPAAYAWADAVLAPAIRPEAFGRVAVEAGAMAKPVIASDHGGARETVVDDVTGIMTPPGDVVAISEAIEALIAMGKEARQTMGARARARVARLYSTEAMSRATIDAYKQLTA